MRKFIGSPSYENLTTKEFEIFIGDYLPKIGKSNFHKDMYILEYNGKLEYLNIHQLIEYWYYEIYQRLEQN